VLHRLAVEIKVLGINGLLVKNLIKLCAQIFEPIIPLRALAVIAQGLDVNDAGYISGTAAVLLSAYDLPLVVDDERSPTKSVDRRFLLGEQIVGSEVRRHNVHVIVQSTGATLNLEDLISGCRVRV